MRTETRMLIGFDGYRYELMVDFYVEGVAVIGMMVEWNEVKNKTAWGLVPFIPQVPRYQGTSLLVPHLGVPQIDV
jgi:hypothetical protein